MTKQERKIIMLSEFMDSRKRKEQELEYYMKQLEEIRIKMSYLQRDLDLTNLIINMIEGENVVDIQQYLEDKKNDPS